MPNVKRQPIRTSAQFLNPEKILAQLNLREEMAIADFGCGTGYFVFPAARMVGEGGVVYAVDVQKSMLSAIESKMALLGLRNVKPVWADLEVLGGTKIKDGTLDMVFIINTLFQSKKHKEFFEEAKRALKTNGILLIIDWKKTEAPMGPHIALRIAKEDVRYEAEKAGFKFAREIEARPYHYGLVLTK